jgi:hypothetical protein
VVAYLREQISDHLSQFKSLYGNVAKLCPKYHLLVHFPTIILKNGPLSGMSCLRYAMKNSFFKKSSGVVCNFINIVKLLHTIISVIHFFFVYLKGMTEHSVWLVAGSPNAGL